METEDFVKKVMKKFAVKGNSTIVLNKPIEITYRYYDEEYECPAFATDEVKAIELLGTNDFELDLELGVVYSSDIEEGDLEDFYNQL